MLGHCSRPLIGLGHRQDSPFLVTIASTGSGPPYFTGKGKVEDMLRDLGVPHSMIRPTLVFGVGDLLLNHMTWALRRLPVFPVYGNGDYPGPTRIRRRPCGPGGGSWFLERKLHHLLNRAGLVLL